jgi:hypothetical protein
MQICRYAWTEAEGWRSAGHGGTGGRAPGLVLYFGDRQVLGEGGAHDELRQRFPSAHLVGCSTGGEILDRDIVSGGAVALAVHFEHTPIRLASAAIDRDGASIEVGRRLGRALAAPDLRGLFVLSDGIHVNGSALVQGLREAVGTGVPVTGGLAGDGARFRTTLVGAGDAPAERRIAAIGLYGDRIRIGHGSVGGWDTFGPERAITRAEGNVLYELDGRPALDLYKDYLGAEAERLPGSALLFPLHIHPPDRREHQVVRTVLSVDEVRRSMTFAGDVPEGWRARLMMGNFENLIGGAAEAAVAAAASAAAGRSGFAVLVSCIGRRLLLGQRIGEEVEAVADAIPGRLPQIGFYSYGEISPHAATGIAELHNQTMTVTVFAEV